MEQANVEGTNGHPSIAPESSDQAYELSSQQQISQDETQEHSSSSYTASEIAERFIEAIDPKVKVDTAAPIDSVKGAVSKFGGITDWKERRKELQDEIDKVQEESTRYQKRSAEAEAGKARALQELDTAANTAESLLTSLEKAQSDEARARHEAELAELRLRESQRGASESVAAKAELDAVRAEVDALARDRAAVAAAAAAADARAAESAAAARMARKAVEVLGGELAALRRELKASHAAHYEAEERRMLVAAALEQDKTYWQNELEEAEHEGKRLRRELMAAYDLEVKAEAAAERLATLKAELFACAVEGTLGEAERPTVSSHSSAELEKVRRELEEVKESVERARDEAKCLRVAAAAMRDGLEKEKAELAALQRKEGLASASVPYLEAELSRMNAEIAEAEARAEHDIHGEMAEQVGQARRVAEQAKAKARAARDEVARAREEAGVAKSAVAAMEARLEAVAREILAATASAEMAVASARALLESENKPARKAGEAAGGVTLTVEEYGELSRRARETEEAAGKRVMEAVKLIKEAKDAEVRSLEKVAKLAKQTEQRRQVLAAATEEAEETEFAKLSAERELRQWRAEHDGTASPRAGFAEISVLGHPDGRGNPHILSPRGYMPRPDVLGAAAEAEARQRKTAFFPRMVMFLARKRAQNWK